MITEQLGATTHLRHRSRGRRGLPLFVTVSALLAVAGMCGGFVIRSHRVYGPPGPGQTSYRTGAGAVVSSSGQTPVPIASLAKVMTAYLVLRDPHHVTVTVTDDDIADTERRAGQDESIVHVAAGETLTEQQALIAILLPSANNVAAMLARAVAGSQDAFIARMNDMARALRMRHTIYTDPSGFDEGTRSTADDQLILAQHAMQLPEFAWLVALRSAELPVAGTVHNTDTLLGKDGFVGIKTGSDDAAGGCFMFRVQRRGGDLTGVVLGRRGHDLIAAGLNAARDLAASVTQRRGATSAAVGGSAPASSQVRAATRIASSKAGSARRRPAPRRRAPRPGPGAQQPGRGGVAGPDRVDDLDLPAGRSTGRAPVRNARAPRVITTATAPRVEPPRRDGIEGLPQGSYVRQITVAP
jgi:serine-type D-Ala-D-Ala carboxypeptidase (penicillin-binding protein 5/6)